MGSFYNFTTRPIMAFLISAHNHAAYYNLTHPPATCTSFVILTKRKIMRQIRGQTQLSVLGSQQLTDGLPPPPLGRTVVHLLLLSFWPVHLVTTGHPPSCPVHVPVTGHHLVTTAFWTGHDRRLLRKTNQLSYQNVWFISICSLFQKKKQKIK